MKLLWCSRTAAKEACGCEVRQITYQSAIKKPIRYLAGRLGDQTTGVAGSPFHLSGKQWLMLGAERV